MKEFFTKQVANEGIKLPLIRPSDGSETAHWLQIRGIDSDAYHRATRRYKSELPDIAATIASIDDEAKRLDFTDSARSEQEVKLMASLVAGWSFDEPCTEENVIEFLTQAPQVSDAIDKIAGKRSRFFTNNSASLKSSPEANLS